MDNTVLIVDDGKENVDGLRAILEKEYNVMVALSGEKALELMSKNKPNCVLLDVLMPGLGGFDVITKMKDTQGLENIPVIFITGATDSFNETTGLKMGAVDYIFNHMTLI